MTHKLNYVLFFWLLVIAEMGWAEPEANLIAFKCKSEYAEIWGVDILNIGSDRYYDSQGNQAKLLRHGMTDFFVAEEQIALDEPTIATIGDTLNKINEWKSATLTPPEIPVVGLHVETTDFLIFHKDSWILVRFHHLNRTFMQVFEARLIIERGKFKVFTRVPSKEPTLSEDKKIIDIFWKLETASKATPKKD